LESRNVYQVVEKRYERRENKAKFNEKAEFMSINEHFEANFNAVLSSAIIFNSPVQVLVYHERFDFRQKRRIF
jgi:adenylate kinase